MLGVGRFGCGALVVLVAMAAAASLSSPEPARAELQIHEGLPDTISNDQNLIPPKKRGDRQRFRPPDKDGEYLRKLWPKSAKVRYVRGIFPFYIGERGREEEAGYLRAWLDRVAAAGAQPFVVLNIGGARKPPRPQRFRRAFKRFLDRFPDVTLIGPWNEPNRDPKPKPGKKLKQEVFVSPARAARYYKDARTLCGRHRAPDKACDLVAGEFAGSDSRRSRAGRRYFRAYLRGIPERKTTPNFKVGFHSARDMLTYQLCHMAARYRRRVEGFDSRERCGSHRGTRAPLTRALVEEIKAEVPAPELWATEQATYKRIPGVEFRDGVQCRAIAFLRTLEGLHGIAQTFHYRFRERGGRTHTGLLTTSKGRRMLAYTKFLIRRASCAPKSTRFARFGYPWITGHDPGSNVRVMADVSGGGTADAAVYFRDTGRWRIATSNARMFELKGDWTNGHRPDHERPLLNDVDGDPANTADAVVFDKETGSWWVAPSNGSSFGEARQWAANLGNGSEKVMLGDVDGNGRADAVIFDKQSGTWSVAPSTGSSFDQPMPKIANFGADSVEQTMDDMDGDELPDAVVIKADGTWEVAIGTGSGFEPPRPWIHGYGINATQNTLDDVTGDSRADAITFNAAGAVWQVAPSNGETFDPPRRWADGHGSDSIDQFVADVTGDDRGDAVTYHPDGTWNVAASRPPLVIEFGRVSSSP